MVSLYFIRCHQSKWSFSSRIYYSLVVEDIIRSVLEEEEAKSRKPGDWATVPTEGEEEVGEARPYQDISNPPIRT